jgi:hypothetical protein
VSLNIIPKSTGLFIQPISNVIPTIPTDDIYSQILEKTAGAWAGDDFDKITAKRRRMELKASEERKKEW